MKKDTRQLILDTAKKLFNERGYNGVSLKDIADELSISKGNLTYHFRKKEEIMESLVLETPKKQFHSTVATLKELDVIFIDLQKTLQEHAYYFLHHAQLSTLSPKIRETQNYAYLETVNTFQHAFHDLHTVGLLQKESFELEYERTINMLLMSCIYWAPFAELQKSIGMKIDFRVHAWSIIYHLLTEKGHLELKNIIQL